MEGSVGLGVQRTRLHGLSYLLELFLPRKREREREEADVRKGHDEAAGVAAVVAVVAVVTVVAAVAAATCKQRTRG